MPKTTSTAANPIATGWYDAYVRSPALDADEYHGNFSFIAGDIGGGPNGEPDHAVGIVDFNILATNFGVTNPAFTYLDGDLDYDGKVGITDFNILASNFDQVLPDLPTQDGGVVVGNTNDNALDVAWATDATGPHDGFKVYRSDASGTNFQLVATLADPTARGWRDTGAGANTTGTTTTTAADTGLTVGSKYWYRVRPYTDAAGASASVTKASGIVSQHVLAVTDLNADGFDAGKIWLTWSKPSGNNVAGYKIYRSTSPNFVPSAANLVTSVGASAIHYSDTGLAAGAQYYYEIVTTGAGTGGSGGASMPSVPAGATAQDEGTAKPSLSNAGPSETDPTGSIVLKYEVPDGASIELEMTGPGHDNFFVYGATVDAVHHTLTATGLLPDKKYQFRLRAERDVKVEYSSTVSVSTAAPVDPNASTIPSLATPQILQVTDIHDFDGNNPYSEGGGGPSEISPLPSWYLPTKGFLIWGQNVYGPGDEDHSPGQMHVEVKSLDPYGVFETQEATDPSDYVNSGFTDGDVYYQRSVYWNGRAYTTTSYPISVQVVEERYGPSGLLYQDRSEPTELTMTPAVGNPDAPKIETVTAPNGEVTVNIEDTDSNDNGANDSSGVTVYRVVNGVASREIYCPGGDGSYTVPSVPGSTLFAVAFNTHGDSSKYSNYANGEGSLSLPAAPSGLATAPVFADTPTDDPAANKVRLIWDNTPDNETGFTIERSDDGGTTFRPVKTAKVDETGIVDTGMKPGTYIYRVESINGNQHSAWVMLTVDVWPPGVLVAFDGTRAMPNHDAHNDAEHQWGGAWGGETAILQFEEAYHGTRQYYAGIGNVTDYPNGIDKMIESAFALEAMRNVVAAWQWLGSRYKALSQADPSIDQHLPVDLIGYSRGAMQAVKLANLIAQNGVPDPDSAYTVRVRQFIGMDPHNHEMYTYHDVPAWHTFFHPHIRFVGLLSPVYMQGMFDAVVGEITFGQIGGLNIGWPTSVPQGHVIILHDGDPTQPDPPRHEETITGDVLDSNPYFFEDGDLLPSGFHIGDPIPHGELGLLQRVLDDLEHAANFNNVPVRDRL